MAFLVRKMHIFAAIYFCRRGLEIFFHWNLFYRENFWGAVCRPRWLTDEGSFRFQHGFRSPKKVKITLETKMFWRIISFSVSIFSPFSYIMKACRWNLILFKIYLRFYERREKTLMLQSMKKKNEEIWTLFYSTGYFMTLKMAINLFFFNKSFC